MDKNPNLKTGTVQKEIEDFTKKDFFGIELSSPEWLIEETDFELDQQHIQESLFTLGNGFIGSRGVLEELPERAMPGTFIAGVYDKAGAQVEELVNLPNPVQFIIAAEGEKLDMNFMGFQKHIRYLDMKQGLLARRTLFKDGKGKRFLYQSLRFFSMKNPGMGCMKVSVTLLDGESELTALATLDDSPTNTGGLIYGSRRHTRLMEANARDNITYAAYRTHASMIWIAYADYLFVEKGAEKTALPDRVYDFKMKAGDTVTFTKIFSICTSLQHRAHTLQEDIRRLLPEASVKGFDVNFKEHLECWQSLWDHANIEIKGDDLCDKALRLNIYHLIIAGYKGNFPMSVGARALTGQGYRGHVFWDAEIFILPFYIYTDPVIAKNMLLYRYKRLHAAKENAKKRGYQGALFPWESAITGNDATPHYAKDIDGSVIKIDTMDYEQHIAADVAYGVFNYYRVTGDIEFISHDGAEIIFQTARFWASRVVLNEKRNKYEIRDVTGPDEFHIRVKNNAYTNIIAGWNMEYASSLYGMLKEKQPEALRRLIQELDLTEKEVDSWKDIASRMYVPASREKGIIEQFEGYFEKKEAVVRSYDNHFMPEAPKQIKYEDFNKTKFVKQADTLLLFHLLPRRFSEEEKLKNYQYYMKYTLHQSSLSHSTHAAIASELGNYLMAYVFFLFASQVDIKNLHNNTDAGMHMANAGGVWQTAIFGFAGICFKDDTLNINPRLPGHWKSMQFNLFWKNCFLKFTLDNDKVAVFYSPTGPEQKSISLDIFGEKQLLEPLKSIEIKRRKEKQMKRIKDIMKKESLVYADENMSLKEISKLLIETNVSSVPIVNNKKELLGIISEKDIIKVTQTEDFAKLKAQDIMKKDVEYVKEDDHVEIAIRIFTERQYRLLPVLKDKVVVGIITRKEVLSACFGEYY